VKILGIDTTTKFLCLGLYDKGKIYEYNLELGKKLSSLISVHIKRILDRLGWHPEDIDYLACGQGPGSFTGMRVGIATIKGLSWAANKPIIGIPSLDLLAMNIKINDKPIMPIVDARRNLVYCSVFKRKDGRLNRIRPYMLLGEKELLKNIKTNAIIFGDALALHKEKIQANIKGVSFLDKDYWQPRAHNIIALAQEKIRNKKFSSAFDIKPIYLYPKECQIKIKNKR